MSFAKWKSDLLQNTLIISDKPSCKRIIDIINNKKKHLLNQPVENSNQSPYAINKLVIGIDCEGVNLGIRGKLTLIQMAFEDEIYIFDVLKYPNVIDFGLRKILEDKDIVKVIHSCDNDILAIYDKFKIILKNVFDIQLAHNILMKQINGVRQRPEGLNTILDYYGIPKNLLKDKIKDIYKKDQKYWAKRPLTEEMMLYAAADVKSLTDPRLYKKMIHELSAKNIKLLARLCLKKTLVQNRNGKRNRPVKQHYHKFQESQSYRNDGYHQRNRSHHGRRFF
ncbi:hypothetical protein GWI33_007781 [Rhynchophorus ferrugineus]|uniref:3'-5' exonuclease domain-containing protein n=1 Tax=Rhynchophorus ferrugineus TaxID=354439 RepID=A0A834ICZ7_RHYFE|nr:hypothetical protein GWI33_007781 [Rhynchophorus ferrugineus]